MKAIYLGGGGVPYTVITGTTIEDIKKQAIAKKINPDNLYGEGFRAISSIPTGNEQALKDLGISISKEPPPEPTSTLLL